MTVLPQRHEGLSEYPAAQISLLSTAATELSWTVGATTGGVAMIDHLEPSQCSARVAVKYWLGFGSAPTPHASVDESATVASSTLPPAWAPPLRLDPIVQLPRLPLAKRGT